MFVNDSKWLFVYFFYNCSKTIFMSSFISFQTRDYVPSYALDRLSSSHTYYLWEFCSIFALALLLLKQPFRWRINVMKISISGGWISCLQLRTSEILLFYNLQLFYWHFLEILWLFIFIVFYNFLMHFLFFY